MARDRQSIIVARNVWLDGKPLAFIEAGTIYFIHADHLDAPQKITDASKALVWDGQFTPFGRTHAIAATLVNKLRFPGQQADTATGYSHNYFRDYEPALGRYIQPDPIGPLGGINRYLYVDANPQNLVDPEGLVAICMKPDLAGKCTRTGRYGQTEGGPSANINRTSGSVWSWSKASTVRYDQKPPIPPKATNQQACRPHGNARDYFGETHAYAIRNSTTGELFKIGQSMQGTNTLGQSKRAQTQVRRLERASDFEYSSRIRRAFSDKLSALEYETALIQRFRRFFGSDTLRGNLNNR